MYEPNVYAGGPPIWLRARTVWRRTGSLWQPAPAGSATGIDVTVVAHTDERFVNGNPDLVDPVTGESNVYWEASVRVVAGAGCYAIAVWYRYGTGPEIFWRFHGSQPIQPGGTKTPLVRLDTNNSVHWCVTAWGPGSTTPTTLPTGQQGYSRFAFA
jgi:hypothetical protein